jgi:ATP-binding protein involved in chromosome partitioning
MLKDQVMQALSQVNDPELHRSLTDLKMVREVKVQDAVVDVTLALTVPNCPLKNQIEADVKKAVGALAGVSQVNVHMTAMTDEERKAIFGEPQEGMALKYNHISRVVAVMSGKGGVGKSLVTALLATGLARQGLRVGVLDADVTGPSIPKLFGLHGPVSSAPVGLRPPQSAAGIKVMSLNLLLESDDQPVVWRGPLIGKAITQLWGDVFWDELDYLLVDLPPGTADAALTTMQALPLDGIVMVTTPQSLASMIVRKAVHMAQMVKVPIAGVVENMAYFVCPDTGKRHDIFGPSHAFEVAQAAYAPLLAQLPIDPTVAPRCDAGQVEAIGLAEIPALVAAFVKAVPLATD